MGRRVIGRYLSQDPRLRACPTLARLRWAAGGAGIRPDRFPERGLSLLIPPGAEQYHTDDAYRSPDELVEGPSSSAIRRKIPDGTAYRIVKVPHQPGDLERRLRQLGWDIEVTATAGPCYWGAGSPA
jgi:hypothetical protein